MLSSTSSSQQPQSPLGGSTASSASALKVQGAAAVSSTNITSATADSLAIRYLQETTTNPALMMKRVNHSLVCYRGALYLYGGRTIQPSQLAAAISNAAMAIAKKQKKMLRKQQATIGGSDPSAASDSAVPIAGGAAGATGAMDGAASPNQFHTKTFEDVFAAEFDDFDDAASTAGSGGGMSSSSTAEIASVLAGEYVGGVWRYDYKLRQWKDCQEKVSKRLLNPSAAAMASSGGGGIKKKKGSDDTGAGDSPPPLLAPEGAAAAAAQPATLLNVPTLSSFMATYLGGAASSSSSKAAAAASSSATGAVAAAFTQLFSSPPLRGDHVCAVVGHHMLVFGGRRFKHIYDDMYAFDFRTRVWCRVLHEKHCGPGAVFSHSAVVVYGGGGGATTAAAATRRNEAFQQQSKNYHNNTINAKTSHDNTNNSNANATSIGRGMASSAGAIATPPTALPPLASLYNTTLPKQQAYLFVMGGVHVKSYAAADDGAGGGGKMLFVYDCSNNRWESYHGPPNVDPNGLHIVEMAYVPSPSPSSSSPPMATNTNHDEAAPSSPSSQRERDAASPSCAAATATATTASPSSKFGGGRLFVIGLDEVDTRRTDSIDVHSAWGERPFGYHRHRHHDQGGVNDSPQSPPRAAPLPFPRQLHGASNGMPTPYMSPQSRGGLSPQSHHQHLSLPHRHQPSYSSSAFVGGGWGDEEADGFGRSGGRPSSAFKALMAQGQQQTQQAQQQRRNQQHLHVLDLDTMVWRRVLTHANPMSPIPFRIAELRACLRYTGLLCSGALHVEADRQWVFILDAPPPLPPSAQGGSGGSGADIDVTYGASDPFTVPGAVRGLQQQQQQQAGRETPSPLGGGGGADQPVAPSHSYSHTTCPAALTIHNPVTSRNKQHVLFGPAVTATGGIGGGDAAASGKNPYGVRSTSNTSPLASLPPCLVFTFCFDTLQWSMNAVSDPIRGCVVEAAVAIAAKSSGVANPTASSDGGAASNGSRRPNSPIAPRRPPPAAMASSLPSSPRHQQLAPRGAGGSTASPPPVKGLGKGGAPQPKPSLSPSGADLPSLASESEAVASPLDGAGAGAKASAMDGTLVDTDRPSPPTSPTSLGSTANATTTTLGQSSMLVEGGGGITNLSFSSSAVPILASIRVGADGGASPPSRRKKGVTIISPSGSPPPASSSSSSLLASASAREKSPASSGPSAASAVSAMEGLVRAYATDQMLVGGGSEYVSIAEAIVAQRAAAMPISDEAGDHRARRGQLSSISSPRRGGPLSPASPLGTGGAGRPANVGSGGSPLPPPPPTSLAGVIASVTNNKGFLPPSSHGGAASNGALATSMPATTNLPGMEALRMAMRVSDEEAWARGGGGLVMNGGGGASARGAQRTAALGGGGGGSAANPKAIKGAATLLHLRIQQQAHAAAVRTANRKAEESQRRAEQQLNESAAVSETHNAMGSPHSANAAAGSTSVMQIAASAVAKAAATAASEQIVSDYYVGKPFSLGLFSKFERKYRLCLVPIFAPANEGRGQRRSPSPNGGGNGEEGIGRRRSRSRSHSRSPSPPSSAAAAAGESVFASSARSRNSSVYLGTTHGAPSPSHPHANGHRRGSLWKGGGMAPKTRLEQLAAAYQQLVERARAVTEEHAWIDHIARTTQGAVVNAPADIHGQNAFKVLLNGPEKRRGGLLSGAGGGGDSSPLPSADASPSSSPSQRVRSASSQPNTTAAHLLVVVPPPAHMSPAEEAAYAAAVAFYEREVPRLEAEVATAQTAKARKIAALVAAGAATSAHAVGVPSRSLAPYGVIFCAGGVEPFRDRVFAQLLTAGGGGGGGAARQQQQQHQLGSGGPIAMPSQGPLPPLDEEYFNLAAANKSRSAALRSAALSGGGGGGGGRKGNSRNGGKTKRAANGLGATNSNGGGTASRAANRRGGALSPSSSSPSPAKQSPSASPLAGLVESSDGDDEEGDEEDEYDSDEGEGGGSTSRRRDSAAIAAADAATVAAALKRLGATNSASGAVAGVVGGGGGGSLVFAGVAMDGVLKASADDDDAIIDGHVKRVLRAGRPAEAEAAAISAAARKSHHSMGGLGALGEYGSLSLPYPPAHARASAIHNANRNGPTADGAAAGASSSPPQQPPATPTRGIASMARRVSMAVEGISAASRPSLSQGGGGESAVRDGGEGGAVATTTTTTTPTRMGIDLVLMSSAGAVLSPAPPRPPPSRGGGQAHPSSSSSPHGANSHHEHHRHQQPSSTSSPPLLQFSGTAPNMSPRHRPFVPFVVPHHSLAMGGGGGGEGGGGVAGHSSGIIGASSSSLRSSTAAREITNPQQALAWAHSVYRHERRRIAHEYEATSKEVQRQKGEGRRAEQSSAVEAVVDKRKRRGGSMRGGGGGGGGCGGSASPMARPSTTSSYSPLPLSPSSPSAPLTARQLGIRPLSLGRDEQRRQQRAAEADRDAGLGDPLGMWGYM